MEQLADHLERAADALATLNRRMPVHSVAASAFGATPTAGGLPGRLGRELHHHWISVLDARSREAAAMAGRITDTAQSVRTARQQYGETDEQVRRRLAREM